MSDLTTTSTMIPALQGTDPDIVIAARAKAPLRVCLLGGRGSGKTCLLGGFAILDRRCGWQLRADSRSITRLDDIVVTLNDRGSWLAPTRETNRYHITPSFKGQTVSFDLFDYPGVYVQTAFRTLNYAAEPELLQHFFDADCILVLLDPDEDFIDAPILAALDDALKHRFIDNRTTRPALAVVLTKADRHDLRTASQAGAFFHQRCPAFLKKIKALGGRVSVIPISAVGAVDENGRPTSDGIPSGYDLLLRWLVASNRARQRRPWRRWLLAGALAVLMAGMTLLAADAWKLWTVRTALSDPDLPAVERLDRTRNYDGWFRALVAPNRSKLAQDEHTRLNAALQATEDEMVARRIADEARNIVLRSPASAYEPMMALMHLAGAKAAGIAQVQVSRLRADNDKSWTDQARLYLDRYHEAPGAAEVRDWLIADMNPEMRAARAPVARIEIDSPNSCLYKAEAIRNYLRDWAKKHPAGERRAIERAAELGELLGRKRDWSLHVHSAGEFKSPRRMWIRLCYPDNNFAGLDSMHAVERISLADESITLEWQPGQALRVQIWGDEGWLIRSDTLAASLPLVGPLALLSLVSDDVGIWLTPDRRWRDSFAGMPHVRFRVRGLDAEDAMIAREFLAPGLRWK